MTNIWREKFIRIARLRSLRIFNRIPLLPFAFIFIVISVLSRLESIFLFFNVRSDIFMDPDAGLKKSDVISEVPAHINRFNFAWRVPNEERTVSYTESYGRLLYAPLRQNSPDGLGHALSTHNADITTAWRLGLTYTHRTGKYGSLTDLPKSNKPSIVHDYQVIDEELYFKSGNAVEHFFGWGANEIPRELIQWNICPYRKQIVANKECIVCDNTDRMKRQQELILLPKEHHLKHPKLRVDDVVILPDNLTYSWPAKPSSEFLSFRQKFLDKHNRPYSVFVMPPEKCKQNPTYSKFRKRSYAYYFNKFWSVHGEDFKTTDFTNGKSESVQLEKYAQSFEEFFQNIKEKKVLPPAVRRPHLNRLIQHEVCIAVHARRGDFFRVGRPMISARIFALVTSKIIALVKESNQFIFSRMPISVSLFSEGMPKVNNSIGHDVSKMDSKFIDIDHNIITEDLFLQMLYNEVKKRLTKKYPNILIKVSLRVSQNTLQSLHEMISADIFIGSESGMSQQLVGSLSRGAFQLLPVVNPEASATQVLFEGRTGLLAKEELRRAKSLWNQYAKANDASARRAVIEHNKMTRDMFV